MNGVKRRVSGEAVFLPLSTYLRYELQLTGTKIVCAEGDCGACTVLVDRPLERAEAKDVARFRAINACILPLGLLDGAHVVTIESLAEERGGMLSEVQAKMVDHQGGQCGFCTPGFVMALTAMFEEHPEPASARRVKNHLTGNLCRCTGYAPIIEAALHVDPGKVGSIRERFGRPEISEDLRAECRAPFCVVDRDRAFHGPTTLADAVRLRGEVANLRVFGAATDLGVQLNKGRFELASALSLNGVDELREVVEVDGFFRIGARADLATIERFFEAKDREPELARFLRIFASPQIKNAATLAGNIINASPIADTIPYLTAAEAELELVGAGGSARRVPITGFYRGYKKIDLAPAELLARIWIPRRAPAASREFLRLYKVSQRRDLDISAVNACFLAQLDATGAFRSVRVAYGGVGPTCVRLPKTEAFLAGKSPTPATIDAAVAEIRAEIAPISDVRGSRDFRMKIAENLFRKFCFELGVASAHLPFPAVAAPGVTP